MQFSESDMWVDNNVVNQDPKGKRKRHIQKKNKITPCGEITMWLIKIPKAKGKGTFRKENNSILDMLDFV